MNNTIVIRDEPTPPITIEDVRGEVAQLDRNLHRNSKTYKTAVVLLSALFVGQDDDALADFTRYDRAFVSLITERMKENSLWSDGKFICNWMDEEAGSVAFWCDVLVAEGKVKFVPTPDAVVSGEHESPLELTRSLETPGLSIDATSILSGVAQSAAGKLSQKQESTPSGGELLEAASHDGTEVAAAV